MARGAWWRGENWGLPRLQKAQWGKPAFQNAGYRKFQNLSVICIVPVCFVTVSHDWDKTKHWKILPPETWSPFTRDATNTHLSRYPANLKVGYPDILSDILIVGYPDIRPDFLSTLMSCHTKSSTVVGPNSFFSDSDTNLTNISNWNFSKWFSHCFRGTCTTVFELRFFTIFFIWQQCLDCNPYPNSILLRFRIRLKLTDSFGFGFRSTTV
jgi:hypothetical protein